MSDDKEVPVWHSIVGPDHEPVQIGEMTQPDEDMLRAGGWVCANGGGGLTYREDWTPRRRRRAYIELSTRKNGCAYGFMKTVRPGDCFRVAEDGELIPIDKPTAEGQVER